MTRAQQAVPNLSGSWVRRGDVVDPSTAPPLTPEGARQYAINQAGIEASDPKIDLILQCLPAGFPRSIESGQPFYIAQTPEAIAWVGASGGRPQMIYMTDKHLGLWPFWMGDYIGKWDGDTLVVEVTGIITKTFLHDSGLPFERKTRQRRSRLSRWIRRFSSVPGTTNDGAFGSLLTRL